MATEGRGGRSPSADRNLGSGSRASGDVGLNTSLATASQVFGGSQTTPPAEGTSGRCRSVIPAPTALPVETRPDSGTALDIGEAIVRVKQELDADMDGFGPVDAGDMKRISENLGTKLSNEVQKKIAFTTQELKKDLTSLMASKDRHEKLKLQHVELTKGKVPRDIHQPGQSFECTSLNNPATAAIPQFVDTGLIFTVATAADHNPSYRDLIDTAFKFQQFVKVGAEIQVIAKHIQIKKDLVAFPAFLKECNAILEEQRKDDPLAALGIDMGPIPKLRQDQEQIQLDKKVQSLYSATINAVVMAVNKKKI